MRYSTALIAFFAANVLAAPAMQKRAAVLTTKTYDQYVTSLDSHTLYHHSQPRHPLT